MKLKITLLLLLILSILPLASAIDCCYPPYPGSGNEIGGIAQIPLGIEPLGSGVTNCLSLGSNWVFVEGCMTDEGDISPENLQVSCCCDTDVNQPETFGAGTLYNPDIIYDYFCEGYSENYAVVQPESPGVCDCSEGGSGALPMNQIIGYVFWDNDTFPLENVIVTEETQIISVTTNEDGSYDLGNVPGVNNGPNIFSATVPDDYTIEYEGEQVLLTCIDGVEERTFSGSYAEIEINFTLDCEISGQACQPNWNVSEWGECMPFGGEYIKLRDVEDLNNCGTTVDRPISVLTQNTPSPEGEAFDCPQGYLLGDCNNGALNDFEQCDYNETGEFFWYRPIPDGEATQTPPTCAQAGLTGNQNSLSCRPDCGYDYTACEPECSVCTGNNCECEICEGHHLCELPCENQTVLFLNEYTNAGENRNLLESYQEGDSTGVYYTEGSDDVTVEWSIQEMSTTCYNEIYGYRIKVCEEDENSPNNCKAETEQIFFSKQATTSYEIQDLLHPGIESNSYCYNVCSLLDDGTELCVYNESDTLPCFDIGDEYCYSWHEPGLNCEFINGDYHPSGCIHAEDESGQHEKTNHSLGIKEECMGFEQCVETPYIPGDDQAAGAKCNTPGSCTLCNGFFGVYAAHNLQSVLLNETGGPIGDYFACEEFKFSPEKYNIPTNDPDETVGLCYEDKAEKTPFTFYDTCEKVISCYEYKTENACVNDPCFKFSTENESEESGFTNSCEWRYLDEGLGIGVCASTIPEEENCRKCDDQSPTGFCNEELCGLYGNCYFKETQNHYNDMEEDVFDTDVQLRLLEHEPGPFLSTCVHERDMACYFYQTQEDCENNGQQIEIETNYALVGEDVVRVVGTNNQTTESADLFGFGDCKWKEEGEEVGCYKDSDDYNTTQNGLQFSDDCFDKGSTNTYKDLTCLQDTTPPVTNLTLKQPIEQEQYLSHNGSYLPVYGLSQLEDLTITTMDDVSSTENIETYFSIVPISCMPKQCYLGAGSCPNCKTDVNTALQCLSNGCPVYPLYSLEDYGSEGEQFQAILEENKSQEYMIIYYSQDFARNLEIVQEDFIFVDISGPVLDEFSYNVSSWNIYFGDQPSDIYSSNLTINFSISEPAYCEGRLYPQLDPETTMGGQIVAANGENFSARYTYLSDATYIYNITCLDDYGNDLHVEKEIIVEGNAAITKPQPKGEIFNSTNSIMLSIETNQTGNCRLDSQKIPYELSRKTFQTTGGQFHENPFTQAGMGELGFDAQASSIYIFYTSCDFGNDSITEMNDGDAITFTVDQLAPTVEVSAKLTDQGSFQPYQEASAPWSFTKSFKLNCSDFDQRIPVEQFGCQKIEYCFAEPISIETFTEANCVSELYEVEGNTATFDASYENYPYYHVYYRATDNGDNQGEFESVHMKLKDTSTGTPEITIV